MAETELSVVCKSCGSEVSPYVTECPYCGTRLRKRAPKLERRGDGLEAQESRRDRRRRERRERKERKERVQRVTLTAERPYVTIALILAPAALLVVARAAVIPLTDLGLVVGTPGFANPWWHYLVSPFLYNDIGYLFAIGVGMVLFVPGPRATARHGPDRAPPGRRGRARRAGGAGAGQRVRRRLHARGRRQRHRARARWARPHGPARRHARGPHGGARHDPDRRLGDGAARPAAGERLRERVVGHHRRPGRASRGLLGDPRAALPKPPMPDKYVTLTPELYAYVVEHGAREDDVLRRLRAETEELGDIAIMQISPEQGAFMTVLVKAMAGRRALELGTFTGYSAICVARGLARRRPARHLRPERRLDQDRPPLFRGGPRRRPHRPAPRPRAGDAPRDDGRRAVRLRLHRRRQERVPGLLRGVPAAPATGRGDHARQRPA